MTRGIFIAGNESALVRAVEAETLKRVKTFASALIPNRLAGVTAPPKNTGTEKTRFALDWNPASPISARTLVLAAENRLGQVDEAILICSPPSIRCSASELPLADVEIVINDHVKGWFFLVRELTAVFSERQRGTLALVYSDAGSGAGRDDAADLLGPSALSSFRSFTHGLLTAARDEPYLTMGFSNSDAGNEAGFAAFMFKYIDEGNRHSGGKLHKYGKFNFFK
jgi:NAD(P)-dependent dehydrogenase (short-subunit alcohol dehydrogenase family)